MFVKTVNEMPSVITDITFALSKTLPSKGSNSVYIASRGMPFTLHIQGVAVCVYTMHNALYQIVFTLCTKVDLAMASYWRLRYVRYKCP